MEVFIPALLAILIVLIILSIVVWVCIDWEEVLVMWSVIWEMFWKGTAFVVVGSFVLLIGLFSYEYFQHLLFK